MTPRTLAIGLATAIALAGQPAVACKCSPRNYDREQVEKAVEAADAVFRGRVLTVKDVRLPNDDGLYSVNARMVSFELVDSWKGPVTQPLVVFTGWGAGDCGYRFELGTLYVVFASYGQINLRGALSTDACTYTTAFTESAELTAFLGVPTPAPTPVPESRTGYRRDLPPNPSLQRTTHGRSPVCGR